MDTVKKKTWKVTNTITHRGLGTGLSKVFLELPLVAVHNYSQKHVRSDG